ncbi:unnamed protein product [Caenorhabditis brenneri]
MSWFSVQQDGGTRRRDQGGRRKREGAVGAGVQRAQSERSKEFCEPLRSHSANNQSRERRRINTTSQKILHGPYGFELTTEECTDENLLLIKYTPPENGINKGNPRDGEVIMQIQHEQMRIPITFELILKFDQDELPRIHQ